MNILGYPKEYFDILFAAKDVKKFEFNRNIIEFLCVLVFVAVLNSIMLLITDIFDLSAVILEIFVVLLVYTFVAGIMHVAFMLYKGKSTFQKDAAVVYKYASAMLFFSTILGFVLSFLGNDIIIGVISAPVFVYMIFIMILNIVDHVTAQEKVSNAKAYQAFAITLAVVVLAFALFGYIVLQSISPDLYNQVVGTAIQ